MCWPARVACFGNQEGLLRAKQAYARVARADANVRREAGFVQAARLSGNGEMRILLGQILPNIMPIMVVQMSLTMGYAILNAAGLSFIGLGISPPDASLGSMAQEGREVYRVHPYVIAIPSIAIAMLVLCANFIADGMRDALDPRTRETKEH
jgi:peptide/nickel transport system permease protein